MNETILELEDDIRIVMMDKAITVETQNNSEHIEDTTNHPLSDYIIEHLKEAIRRLSEPLEEREKTKVY